MKEKICKRKFLFIKITISTLLNRILNLKDSFFQFWLFWLSKFNKNYM